MKVEWTSWAPAPDKPTVSVDIKQHSTNQHIQCNMWKCVLHACRHTHPHPLSLSQSVSVSKLLMCTTIFYSGFRLSNRTLQSLVMRYSNRDGQVEFGDFIVCAVRLKTMLSKQHLLCTCVCVHACVCVYVCVRERERERKCVCV